MGFPNSKWLPRAKPLLAALILLFAYLSLSPAPAAAAYPDQASCLMRIKESSLHFGRLLEEVVFNEGIANAEVRDTVTKINEWIDKNCYPRINQFLDSLDETDVKEIYNLFKRGADVKSSAELPIYEDLSVTGQSAVLSPPFRGEVSVVKESPGAEPATGTRNSWKFSATQPTGAAAPPSGMKAHFLAMAPAPGQPVYSIAAPGPGAPSPETAAAIAAIATSTSGCPSNGTVFLDHGGGESSLFYCVEIPIDRPKDNEIVPRSTVMAYAIPDNGGVASSFHYAFLKTGKDARKDFQPRFALYFAIGENEAAFHLVLSGVPQPGQFLIDHETYIERNSGR